MTDDMVLVLGAEQRAIEMSHVSGLMRYDKACYRVTFRQRISRVIRFKQQEGVLFCLVPLYGYRAVTSVRTVVEFSALYQQNGSLQCTERTAHEQIAGF